MHFLDLHSISKDGDIVRLQLFNNSPSCVTLAFAASRGGDSADEFTSLIGFQHYLSLLGDTMARVADGFPQVQRLSVNTDETVEAPPHFRTFWEQTSFLVAAHGAVSSFELQFVAA